MNGLDLDLSVVAPCYNEEGNVGELTARLLRVFEKKHIRGEVVLVNDASQDMTGQAIDRLASGHQNVVSVHHATNQGIAAGWATGRLPAAVGYTGEIVRVGQVVFVRGQAYDWFAARLW